jgi:hypothetical protein
LIVTRIPVALIEEFDAVSKYEDRTKSQALRKIVRKCVNTVRSGQPNEFLGLEILKVLHY